MVVTPFYTKEIVKVNVFLYNSRNIFIVKTIIDFLYFGTWSISPSSSKIKETILESDQYIIKKNITTNLTLNWVFFQPKYNWNQTFYYALHIKFVHLTYIFCSRKLYEWFTLSDFDTGPTNLEIKFKFSQNKFSEYEWEFCVKALTN